jgi:hypothetical protein
MHVQDIDGGYQVNGEAELESVLQRRNESGANAL